MIKELGVFVKCQKNAPYASNSNSFKSEKKNITFTIITLKYEKMET